MPTRPQNYRSDLARRFTRIALAAGILALTPAVNAASANTTIVSGNTSLGDNTHPLPIADDARARVIALTGLSNIKSIQPFTLKESDLPFLASQIINRPLWKIEFTQDHLKLKSSIPNYPDQYPRNFVALLDQATGRLVSIKSSYGPPEPQLSTEAWTPPAEYLMRQEKEMYLGFPLTDPKVNFLAALDGVLSTGEGSPFLAKEIEAIYVIYSGQNVPKKPYWIITMRGIPPTSIGSWGLPSGMSEETYYKLHHISAIDTRNVVDPTTGKAIMSSGTDEHAG